MDQVVTAVTELLIVLGAIIVLVHFATNDNHSLILVSLPLIIGLILMVGSSLGKRL